MASEQLFLLEVLVEEVKLTDDTVNTLETPLRVRIRFVDFPHVEIKQEEFSQAMSEIKGGGFGSGKSCLFSMEPQELLEEIKEHPLGISVFRKLLNTPIPDLLGNTTIKLSDGICDMIREVVDGEHPPARFVQDTCPLIDVHGNNAGTITLFVRLSCFGHSIITQFQLLGEEKAYLFKNSEDETSFQCKSYSEEGGITVDVFEKKKSPKSKKYNQDEIRSLESSSESPAKDAIRESLNYIQSERGRPEHMHLNYDKSDDLDCLLDNIIKTPILWKVIELASIKLLERRERGGADHKEDFKEFSILKKVIPLLYNISDLGSIDWENIGNKLELSNDRDINDTFLNEPKTNEETSILYDIVDLLGKSGIYEERTNHKETSTNIHLNTEKVSEDLLSQKNLTQTLQKISQSKPLLYKIMENLGLSNGERSGVSTMAIESKSINTQYEGSKEIMPSLTNKHSNKNPVLYDIDQLLRTENYSMPLDPGYVTMVQGHVEGDTVNINRNSSTSKRSIINNNGQSPNHDTSKTKQTTNKLLWELDEVKPVTITPKTPVEPEWEIITQYVAQRQEQLRTDRNSSKEIVSKCDVQNESQGTVSEDKSAMETMSVECLCPPSKVEQKSTQNNVVFPEKQSGLGHPYEKGENDVRKALPYLVKEEDLFPVKIGVVQEKEAAQGRVTWKIEQNGKKRCTCIHSRKPRVLGERPKIVCTRPTSEPTKADSIDVPPHGYTPLHPPVRYDTTGRLSPAFRGVTPLGGVVRQHPPVRYDTTGRLSAAYSHPPVRFDTTGKLSSAAETVLPTEGICVPDERNVLLLDDCDHEAYEVKAGGIETPARKKKRNRQRRYVYNWGKPRGLDAPLLDYGHRYCLDPGVRVPGNKGYLWDSKNGWRPGAISRTVSRMMKKILNRKVSEEVLAVTEYIPTPVTHVKEEECVPAGPKVRPTLHVHRHAGTFYVSMYPVDQDLDRAPLQFKIPTSKGQECKEDEQGRPISCRSSDLEVEVVSPAALVPKPLKRSVRNVDTQYDDRDISSLVEEVMEEQPLEHRENNHNGKIKNKNGNLKLRNGNNINKHDKPKDGNNPNMKKDPELSKNVGEDVPVHPPLGIESDELLSHVEMEQNDKKGKKVEFAGIPLGTKGHGYYYY